jgi:hypothetical protein
MKRHVMTDDQDDIPLLSVVVITLANTHDMKALKDMLDSLIVQRPSCKQNLCMSYKAYDFLEIEGEAKWSV